MPRTKSIIFKWSSPPNRKTSDCDLEARNHVRSHGKLSVGKTEKAKVSTILADNSHIQAFKNAAKRTEPATFNSDIPPRQKMSTEILLKELKQFVMEKKLSQRAELKMKSTFTLPGLWNLWNKHRKPHIFLIKLTSKMWVFWLKPLSKKLRLVTEKFEFKFWDKSAMKLFSGILGVTKFSWKYQTKEFSIEL